MMDLPDRCEFRAGGRAALWSSLCARRGFRCSSEPSSAGVSVLRTTPFLISLSRLPDVRKATLPMRVINSMIRKKRHVG